YFQALSHGVRFSTGLPAFDFFDGFSATNEFTFLYIPYESNDIRSAVPSTFTMYVVPDLNEVNSLLLPSVPPEFNALSASCPTLVKLIVSPYVIIIRTGRLVLATLPTHRWR